MLRSCLVGRPVIRATILKLKNFLLLPVSALNTILVNEVVPKTVVEKFSFSELEIEKVKFFFQGPTKMFLH